jgi:hypothetical protein
MTARVWVPVRRRSLLVVSEPSIARALTEGTKHGHLRALRWPGGVTVADASGVAGWLRNEVDPSRVRRAVVGWSRRRWACTGMVTAGSGRELSWSGLGMTQVISTAPFPGLGDNANGNSTDMKWVILLVVVVVVAVVAGLVVVGRNRARAAADARRVEANETRDQAAANRRDADRLAAAGEERTARAKQETLAAEAQRLAAVDSRAVASDLEARADELDPDVRT